MERTSHPPIFTIGHGVRSLHDFVATLTSASASRVVDVRRYPASRRHPHFASQALTASLAERGIEYRWLGDDLGGSRRPSRRPSHWRNPAFAAYAEHIETEAFARGLAEVERAASEGHRIALMCSETLWWRCHRRLIGDALAARGFDVRHLIRAGSAAAPHRLTTHR